MTGVCALCGATAVLCRSHLLPRALYRYIMDKAPPGQHPIHVGGGTAVPTDRQIAGHLLCRACEQRFSTQGERPVLGACYRGAGSFELERLIQQHAPIYSDSDTAFYDARHLGVLRNQLTYFAISVVWRWSVGHHIWPRSTKYAGRLGPFEDCLRPYLLGKDSLPSTAIVWVEAMRATVPLEVLSLPAGDDSGSPRYYEFWIPGIRFVVQVGRGGDPAVNRVCLSGTHTPSICHVDPRKRRSFAAIVEFVRSAEPKGLLIPK